MIINHDLNFDQNNRDYHCGHNRVALAHTLNLASQRTLKLPAVARLLGKVRRITTFFHRSTIANFMLEPRLLLLRKTKEKTKTRCDFFVC